MQFLNFAGPHAQGCFVVVAVVPFYVYAEARVRFMSSSSSSRSSSFAFQSSKFGSSSISNRLAQGVH